LQRAKLFVKLKYGDMKSKTLMDKIRSIKFKKSANQFISDGSLPNKGQLINITKEELFVDYKLFKVPGLKSIKERVILLIFIFHKIFLDTQTSNLADS
jgi:hypothetical protein